MKVLWFEVSEPSGYRGNGEVLGGWQDSLEKIVRQHTNIELYIAFASETGGVIKREGQVNYIPIEYNLSKINKIRSLYSCQIETKCLLPHALSVIEEVKPDIIHVFGLEWLWGLVAEHTDIPVVIHIMGSMLPYYNSLYPPKYSLQTIVERLWPNIKDIVWEFFFEKKQASRRNREYLIWKSVRNYMGRTQWDYALCHVLHPNCNYFHVEEALRDVFFIEEGLCQHPQNNVKLISTGSRSYWKGPDMFLKTAKILKDFEIDFEWKVIGGMKSSIKQVVEDTERIKFADCNVEIMGFKSPSELKKMLMESTIYVHTAYIENSPNSICEAQCMGLPIVSTNVGGISSLVADGEDGILVPANDPWQMAYAIITLIKDSEKREAFSRKAKEKALKRHDPQNILNGLLCCYNHLIGEGK